MTSEFPLWLIPQQVQIQGIPREPNKDQRDDMLKDTVDETPKESRLRQMREWHITKKLLSGQTCELPKP